ncbi:hypothetical protein R1flu_027410 [Riccia fluitans]|uniref:Uncharacterized protein n=1 Tax=Riccia fluitans TaxID=41844 RepID=A0ABD1XIR6_9MARC
MIFVHASGVSWECLFFSYVSFITSCGGCWEEKLENPQDRDVSEKNIDVIFSNHFGLCLMVVGTAGFSEASEAMGSISGLGTEMTCGDTDCLDESRRDCLRAEAKGCIWSDLPRSCYSATHSLEAIEFCTRKKSKVFVKVWTCDEIANPGTCILDKSCCCCDILLDGCFDRLEAIRFPKHIYSCPNVADS